MSSAVVSADPLCWSKDKVEKYIFLIYPYLSLLVHFIYIYIYVLQFSNLKAQPKQNGLSHSYKQYKKGKAAVVDSGIAVRVAIRADMGWLSKE